MEKELPKNEPHLEPMGVEDGLKMSKIWYQKRAIFRLQISVAWCVSRGRLLILAPPSSGVNGGDFPGFAFGVIGCFWPY